MTDEEIVNPAAEVSNDLLKLPDINENSELHSINNINMIAT